MTAPKEFARFKKIRETQRAYYKVSGSFSYTDEFFLMRFIDHQEAAHAAAIKEGVQKAVEQFRERAAILARNFSIHLEDDGDGESGDLFKPEFSKQLAEVIRAMPTEEV